MTKLKVIGYSNRPNCYERNWSTSLKRCKYNYKLIGQNEKWKGWVTRPKAYLKYLLAQPNNNETIYVFIDVHDVAANSIEHASEKYITKFKRIGKPIVLGAEPNCTSSFCRPLTNYWNDNSKISPNIYLNLGLLSGYRNELINLMEYLIIRMKYQEYYPKVRREYGMNR